MRSVSVTWRPGEDRFVAEGSHAGFAIPINAPHDGGITGFSATELLLAGIGGCAAWDVLEILRKQRQQVDGIEIVVEGRQDADPPWAYHHIELRFRFSGRELARDRVERAVALSVERYCSVLATTRGVSEVSTSVTIDGEADPPLPVGGDPSESGDPRRVDIRPAVTGRTEDRAATS